MPLVLIDNFFVQNTFNHKRLGLARKFGKHVSESSGCVKVRNRNPVSRWWNTFHKSVSQHFSNYYFAISSSHRVQKPCRSTSPAEIEWHISRSENFCSESVDNKNFDGQVQGSNNIEWWTRRDEQSRVLFQCLSASLRFLYFTFVGGPAMFEMKTKWNCVIRVSVSVANAFIASPCICDLLLWFWRDL